MRKTRIFCAIGFFICAVLNFTVVFFTDPLPGKIAYTVAGAFYSISVGMNISGAVFAEKEEREESEE